MPQLHDQLRMTKLFFTILTFVVLSFIRTALADDPPPNILLIMADDLGAENLACYGNTVYSTPNLDRMAAEGARFENAYATPVCTPTRAMILTGLYPNRSGFLERLDSPDDVEKNNRLPVHLKTLGHVFQAAGYRTAIAGKWHLGDFQKYPDQPTSHGFDEHCLWVQYWDGERRSRYYGPHNWENGTYKVHGDDVFGPDYYCDFLSGFIERSANQQLPFFAYFPMNLIHSPLVTPPGNLDVAESRYPKDLGPSERKAGQMIHYMDVIVGRLLSKLEELRLEQTTLVIFTGDNGTGGNLVSRLGDFRLRGGKRTMNEAGTRVPFIARWPGEIPPGRRDSIITLMDMLPTLASMAKIPVGHEIDGMDLSHNLYHSKGKDRKHFFMAFEGDVYFVRDKRFRLHEDGRFYDVSVAGNETRYDMNVVGDSMQHADDRRQLQRRLDDFMRIKQTDGSYSIIPFGTNGDNFKNAQDKASIDGKRASSE
ncbi:MAG: sulfatase-like hydrolase/transferase [Planctomycetota bacterium]